MLFILPAATPAILKMYKILLSAGIAGREQLQAAMGAKARQGVLFGDAGQIAMLAGWAGLSRKGLEGRFFLDLFAPFL